eukprot:753039-Hanusia_phi.AAC.4
MSPRCLPEDQQLSTSTRRCQLNVETSEQLELGLCCRTVVATPWVARRGVAQRWRLTLYCPALKLVYSTSLTRPSSSSSPSSPGLS